MPRAKRYDSYKVSKKAARRRDSGESLCIRCANSTPLRCLWLRDGDMSGVARYSVRVVRDWTDSRDVELVRVLECANFKEGSLPPLAASW